jgi:hypothetical protein
VNPLIFLKDCELQTLCQKEKHTDMTATSNQLLKSQTCLLLLNKQTKLPEVAIGFHSKSDLSGNSAFNI